MTDVSVEKVQIASNSCGLKDFNEIHFLFPPPGSLFLAGLSEKQVINLVWPHLHSTRELHRPGGQRVQSAKVHPGTLGEI